MARNKENCPLCDTELAEHKDYMDTTLMESQVECNNCGYIREYATGNYHVCIGDKEFYWSYRTPNEEVAKIDEQMQEAIQLVILNDN